MPSSVRRALGLAILLSISPLSAQNRTITVTIYAPERQLFALALNELQLEWVTAAGRPARPDAPRNAGAATLLRREGSHAVFAVRDVTTLEELAMQARLLEAANPNTRGEFVVYEPERVTREGRRVLTRDVSLILEDASDPEGLIEQYAANLTRAAAGTSAGFIISTTGPLEAIQLADLLRRQTGVVSATPLLRQQQQLR